MAAEQRTPSRANWPPGLGSFQVVFAPWRNSEHAGAIVGEGLLNLGLGVHDERAAEDDRLAQRRTGQQQDPRLFLGLDGKFGGTLAVLTG